MSDKPSLAIRTVTPVGLGKMGRSMAMRLHAAGFPRTCYDRGTVMSEPLLKAGATGAATLQDAVLCADAVITMLPDGQTVRDAMPGRSVAAEAQEELGDHADRTVIYKFLKHAAESNSQRGKPVANHDRHLRPVE